MGDDFYQFRDDTALVPLCSLDGWFRECSFPVLAQTQGHVKRVWWLEWLDGEIDDEAEEASLYPTFLSDRPKSHDPDRTLISAMRAFEVLIGVMRVAITFNSQRSLRIIT